MFMNTKGMSPARALEHSASDDLRPQARSKPAPWAACPSNDINEAQKSIRAADQQEKSHADPLKPDKAWSLTEPNLFSYVATMIKLKSNGAKNHRSVANETNA